MAKLSRSQLSRIKKQMQDNSVENSNKDNKKNKKSLKQKVKSLKAKGEIIDTKSVFIMKADIGDLVSYKERSEELLGIIVKVIDENWALVSTNKGTRQVNIRLIRKIE